MSIKQKFTALAGTGLVAAFGWGCFGGAPTTNFNYGNEYNGNVSGCMIPVYDNGQCEWTAQPVSDRPCSEKLEDVQKTVILLNAIDPPNENECEKNKEDRENDTSMWVVATPPAANFS